MTDKTARDLAAAIRELAASVRERRTRPRREAGEVPPYSEAFDTFWRSYDCPRRRNKPAAWAQWRLVIGPAGGAGTILSALADFKKSDKWRDGYMPEPARWLKSQPWLDEPTESDAGKGDDGWEVRK